MLYKRSEELIVQGDIAAARLMLTRAAEAGDARAAFALGATYDFDVLRKLGVLGVAADVGAGACLVRESGRVRLGRGVAAAGADRAVGALSLTLARPARSARRSTSARLAAPSRARGRCRDVPQGWQRAMRASVIHEPAHRP